MNIQLLKQKEMLEAYIKTGECRDKRQGLCDNVLIDNHYFDYWDAAFKTWPPFNGSLAFPIEGHSSLYATNDRKHDRRTKYGKLRLSLAKHCLQHVMNELENDDG
jgi:hypothetical protein